MRSTGSPKRSGSSGIARRAPARAAARASSVGGRSSSALASQHEQRVAVVIHRRRRRARQRRDARRARPTSATSATSAIGSAYSAAGRSRRRAGARRSELRRAHDAPSAPVRKRRIELAQHLARARVIASADATISAIDSSWPRDVSVDLAAPRRCRARRGSISSIDFDHALGVARLGVGVLEDLLGAARGLADRRADLLERVRDRVDVLAALADHLARLAHLVGHRAGCRPRSRGSASRSRRRCAPRSRRACGSRRPRPRSRGPPRPRAPPRSRRSARAGSCGARRS